MSEMEGEIAKNLLERHDLGCFFLLGEGITQEALHNRLTGLLGVEATARVANYQVFSTFIPTYADCT